MNEQPVALINSGVNCYLNSSFQAISACRHFILEINKLRHENCNLKKLSLLCSLMDSVNETAVSRDISHNHIFREWTKTGQQDSFELLSYVINQVYNEIRMEKEDEKENLRKWLDVKLPLRMTMKYEFNCECGSKDSSPLQSDIAFHLSFHKRSVNKGCFYLQNMLENHFAKENIFDYKCGKFGCKKEIVTRELKLNSPLPITICIHLQRLYYNGLKMKKVKDIVLFCNRISIKGEYMKRREDIEDKGDVHYYLKSVIVHYGEESSGHYICYRKYNNTWYYTSDTNIHVESAQRVFECNPYILFYERENEEEIIPTIIKVDDKLNIFINAISSCAAFIKWLNKEKINNKSETIKRLVYLTDLANGNITRNKEFEEKEIKKWCNKGDVYETMNNIFSEINSTNYGGMEEVEFPFGISVKSNIICKCGFKENCPFQKESVFRLAKRDQKNLTVQNIFENYFQYEIQDYKCGVKGCTHNVGTRKLKLQSPLPYIICIHLQRYENRPIMEIIDHKVSFCNRITIRKENFENQEDVHYYLKSVIENKMALMSQICYKKYNNTWYYTSDTNIDVESAQRVFECNPYILFYEREDEEEIIPTIIKLDNKLNIFINAISSFAAFIKWLNKEKINNKSETIKRLVYLTDLANGNITRNKEFEEKEIKNWCNKGNLYDIMKGVMSKVITELNLKEFINSPYLLYEYDLHLPTIITLSGGKGVLQKGGREHGDIFDRFIDMSYLKINKKNEGQFHLQQIFDDYPLSINSDSVCIYLQMYNKNRKKNNQGVAYSGSVKIRNTTGDTDTRYYLKAIVYKDKGTVNCVKHVGGSWYLINNCEVKLVDEVQIFKCDPDYLFFEKVILNV